MDIKQILEKLRHQEEKRGEYFFALQIETGLVKSAIWAVEGDQVKVLAIGRSENWQDEAGLIEAADTSLSSAVEKFSPERNGVEPDKVIFGVSPDWVGEERIKPERLKTLKELSQKLALKPVGFVVTVEAIIHHLRNLEGVPPTATLVGIRKEQLAVAVANLGKVVGYQVVERSESLGADLLEGLSRFSEEHFPARILLYNGVAEEEGVPTEGESELEEAKQELINYPWQDNLVHFLHLPKVEILSNDFDIKAVTLAGGFEVGQAREISGFAPEPEVDKEKETVSASDKEEEVEEGGREGETAVEEKGAFGFVQGQDVTEQPPLSAPSPEFPLPPVGEEEEKTYPSKLAFLSLFDRLRLRLTRIDFSLLANLIPRLATTRRTSVIFTLVGGFVLITGGFLLTLYWYLPRAKITLSITPQKLEKEFTFTLNPSGEEGDEEELVLPAGEIKTFIEGAKTRQTTGTKLIGDPARGEVTIYNRTSTRKALPAGTNLTGPHGLKFSLGEEVMVASESAGLDYTRVPGKATTKATAMEIGTEGNLAAGTEFQVANYSTSDLVAKNESALSGGTSREIQAVSQDDRGKLLAELKEELEKKALDEISPKVSLGKKFLAESLSTAVIEKSFNKDVGEEANEINLSLKLEARALVYNEGTLRDLIEKKIKGSIPSGFEYRREESEIDYSLKEMEKDGRAVILAHFTAHLIPEINLETVRQNLAGKNLFLGKTYLDNLPNVSGVKIELFPPLPGKLATFPRITKRIEFQLIVD